MDTCYSAAVEYFLSFFGSWRDGQDPAVLSLATIAPAPTSDAPVSSCEENKLHRGRCSMECEADMDFRRSWSLFSYFVFFLESLCVFFRIFLFVRFTNQKSQTVVNEQCAAWEYRPKTTCIDELAFSQDWSPTAELLSQEKIQRCLVDW